MTIMAMSSFNDENGCFSWFGGGNNNNNNNNNNAGASALSSSPSSSLSFGIFSTNNNNGKDNNSIVDPAAMTLSSKELDSLIAREMTRLSMQEREHVFEDIHGISKKIDEDPAYVNAQLADMDYQLLRLLKEASSSSSSSSIIATATKPRTTTTTTTTTRSTISNNLFTTSRIITTAYEEAEAMSPTHVKNRDFRLMFLRAEKFEAKDAADRMIKFFELKKKLFGKEKLVKQITIQDLDEDDMECLASGGCQLSPYKDAAGRHIISFNAFLRKQKKPENAMRATYYVLMSVMESVDAQKRGVVAIWYYVNSTFNRSLTTEVRRFLPVHYASLHLCMNDPGTYESVILREVHGLNTKSRVRYRLHWGTNIECLYELGQFGIPRVALPVSVGGEYQNKDHLLWLEKRRQMDAEKERRLQLLQTLQNEIRPHAVSPFSSNDSVDTTSHNNNNNNNNNNRDNDAGSSVQGQGQGQIQIQIQVLPDDVLFGRTRGVVAHPGNTRFRQIIDIYMSRYEEAAKFEKKLIAESIVRMIQESAGRFLKSSHNGDDGWEIVDDAAAREKVAHAFRNRRKYHGHGV